MSKSIYSIIVLPKTKYQKTFSSGLGKNIKIINNNYFTYNFNKIYHVKKKNTNYNIIKKINWPYRCYVIQIQFTFDQR